MSSGHVMASPRCSLPDDNAKAALAMCGNQANAGLEVPSDRRRPLPGGARRPTFIAGIRFHASMELDTNGSAIGVLRSDRMINQRVAVADPADIRAETGHAATCADAIEARMSKKQQLDFSGQEIDVPFDGRLCIHVGECGYSTGELFVADREPWCAPDLVSKQEVREIVERCPSGALSYVDKAGEPESAPPENAVRIANDGPLYLTGDLEIDGAGEDMPGVRYRAALCRCGASKNKPFCDNSHIEANFRDYGAVGDKGPGLTATGGKLKVEMRPDGPLVLIGNLSIHAGSGRLAWQGDKAFLCRCGASKNKPFCDGTHKKVGFKS
jgi:CDGSH-type Zn-finger protein/uncharacterized Fe-S cluster protein YjdI